MSFRTLDDVDVAGKRVLLRADLNVPVRDGKISDLTRIERLTPTIRELVGKGAQGHRLQPLRPPQGQARAGDVAGADRHRAGRGAGSARALRRGLRRRRWPQQAVERMARGDVLVLENTRFHAEEEKNDPAFAAELAKLADIYVNDAFSAAHRAHASTEGVAHLLPAYAGRLMQAELEALDAALGNPVRPVAAIVGGAKVSTKLDLLGNLVGQGERAGDRRRDGQHVPVGAGPSRSAARCRKPRCTRPRSRSWRAPRRRAARSCCRPMRWWPSELKPGVATQTVAIGAVPADAMILDVGPATVDALIRHLAGWRTLVWNGPLGAFETPPFDAATTAFAKAVADATGKGALRSVAGGGDTVSALRHAGVLDRMSYVSTAGGAFLEWLEGKTLPGVAALG